jgi:2C-methyl-D-erythritol 2,4-cyclodiphosphate synthase
VTTSADDQQELEKEIEQTREQLGQTVEALAARVDVKARAQEKLGQAGQQIRERPVSAAATVGVIGALVLFFALIRRWMRRDK